MWERVDIRVMASKCASVVGWSKNKSMDYPTGKEYIAQLQMF